MSEHDQQREFLSAEPLVLLTVTMLLAQKWPSTPVLHGQLVQWGAADDRWEPLGLAAGGGTPLPGLEMLARTRGW